MEKILQNARTDSAHLQAQLDSERSRNQSLERELASVQSQFSGKLSEWNRDQVEHAQLKGEFEVVQGSLGGVGESMQRATDTIKALQQVGGAWGGAWTVGEIQRATDTIEALQQVGGVWGVAYHQGFTAGGCGLNYGRS